MKSITTILILLTTSVLIGQIEHPKASPYAKVEQEVGLSKITVTYSRPAVRGRTIFGDLVPFGRIWRVGANESTKFSIDTDMVVLGNKLPKGTYALYAFPDEDAWEVVFHKNTQHWGDGRDAYRPEEDAFRIKIVPETIPYLQENFLIAFDAIVHNQIKMMWIWEHTKVTIPLDVDTDHKMRQQISLQIEENPTAQTYYEAARYLQEQGQDLPIALLYLNKAIELGGDTYYFHRVKSLVEASLEEYVNAIISAKLSMQLAGQENKDEFVRMNQKNIDLWSKILEEQ